MEGIMWTPQIREIPRTGQATIPPLTIILDPIRMGRGLGTSSSAPPDRGNTSS